MECSNSLLYSNSYFSDSAHFYNINIPYFSALADNPLCRVMSYAVPLGIFYLVTPTKSQIL